MDSLKEIFDALGQRIKSPFFGYTTLAYIACNWRALFVIVFTDESAASKFEYFDDNANIASLFVLPIAIGVLITWLAPRISYWAATVATEPINKKRINEVIAAHEVLQAENKLAVERENEKSLIETIRIEQAKRDAEIAKIDNEEIRTELKGQIKELREEISSSEASLEIEGSPVIRAATWRELKPAVEFGEGSFLIGRNVVPSFTRPKRVDFIAFPSSKDADIVEFGTREGMYIDDDIKKMLADRLIEKIDNDWQEGHELSDYIEENYKLSVTARLNHEIIEYQFTLKGYKAYDRYIKTRDSTN